MTQDDAIFLPGNYSKNTDTKSSYLVLTAPYLINPVWCGKICFVVRLMETERLSKALLVNFDNFDRGHPIVLIITII